MYELIETLKQKEWLWQGSHLHHSCQTLASGFSVLDEHLGGGFPQHGVITLQTQVSIGELRLWMPSLCRHTDTAQSKRLIVFIHPPAQLNAEFFVAEKIPLDQILLIQSSSSKDALWATEQCLKSGACRDVFLWHNGDLDIAQARRLEVASHTGQCRHILIRQNTEYPFSRPVSLAMHLAPSALGIDITIQKRKGGWSPQRFTVDMRPYWPVLALKDKINHVIPFPHQQQG